MKNLPTLGLVLGTTCLATLAFTQTSRPGDAPAQERRPTATGQDQSNSVQAAQRQLHQAVASEVQTCAAKHGVMVDNSNLMISLVGTSGVIAGVPMKGSSSSATDPARKGSDASATGRDQNPATPKGANSGAADQNVVGVILLSPALAPSGAGVRPGATDSTGGQRPQGADASGKQGSSDLVAYKVRRNQQGNGSVELVGDDGRVALQVQLLNTESDGMRRTREASSPRDVREDAKVGNDPKGDPLGDPRNQGPESKDRGRSADAQDGSMRGQGADDWSVVYASVVYQVCQQHHGKK